MKYWPFSLRGSAVLLAAVALLGTSLPVSNPYGIILAALLLVYLFSALGALVFISLPLDPERFQWRCLPGTVASRVTGAGKGEHSGRGRRNHILLSFEAPLPPLFRCHFSLRGILYNGKTALYRQRKDVCFTGETAFALTLPLPGLFRCRGKLYLGDFFGFLRFPLTPVLHREIGYYPPLLAQVIPPRPKAAEESEETVKTNVSNPERIFNRDYQPGDLARDINWKASGKFSSVYTRIAPDSADKTTRLTVAVRTNGIDEKKEPERSALLLGLKAFSQTLIIKLGRDYPESVITVLMGNETYSSDEEELEVRALPALSALGWKEPLESMPLQAGHLICTTMADRERSFLETISPGLVFTAGCGGEEEPDLVYQMFGGNALPGSAILKSYSPGLMRRLNRLLQADGTPFPRGTIQTGAGL